MTIKTELLQLNSDAMDCMRAGDNESATELLVHGLAQLSSMLNESPHVLTEYPKHEMLDICSTSLRPDDDGGDDQTEAFCSSTTPTQQTFFDRAFQVLSTSCPSNMNCVTSLASVLLFNTALSFHRLGVSTGNTDHLARALRLYNQIFVAARDYALAPRDPLNVLILAATCNVEQLCTDFGDFDGVSRARRIFHQVFGHSSLEAATQGEKAFFVAEKWQLEFDPLPLAPAA